MDDDTLAAIEQRAAALVADPIATWGSVLAIEAMLATDLPALVAALRELRAAARAVVVSEANTVNAGYQRCRTCYYEAPTHAHDCLVGRLAALLDGGEG